METNTTSLPVLRSLDHDLGLIRTGITDARRDFSRMYDFYSGKCDADCFAKFLAIGDFYTEPLTKKAWLRTIFKEIDRVEALFAA